MGNPVVHFEVNGPEPELAAKFYGELFGWHLQSMPEMSYWTVDTHGGRGINGGLGQTREGQQPFVTFYVGGDDIQALLDKAESGGGKTITPVTEIPKVVTFALFADPDGNVIGLVKSEPDTEAPGVSTGDGAPVTWFEILGPDPKRAWDFYGQLFGWTVEDMSGDGFIYGQVDTGADKRIPGGIGSSPDGLGHVNLYAEVDDPQKYLERAESLGGKTLMPATQMGDGTWIALLVDPQGTSFGLVKPTG
jgi:predicted enzyme related to lactoylglutathione lyase